MSKTELVTVTFCDSTLNTANLCPAGSVVNFLLIYCDVCVCLVWNSGPFLDIVCSRNVGEDSVDIFSCIDSGIFWTGIFEMPEEYNMCT